MESQADSLQRVHWPVAVGGDQDIILFEDTIANNIKMWDQSIEDFEMILAARDAQLHEEFIMARDGGHQHRLAEGGTVRGSASAWRSPGCWPRTPPW